MKALRITAYELTSVAAHFNNFSNLASCWAVDTTFLSDVSVPLTTTPCAGSYRRTLHDHLWAMLACLMGIEIGLPLVLI